MAHQSWDAGEMPEVFSEPWAITPLPSKRDIAEQNIRTAWAKLTPEEQQELKL
jgi:hypothetical protein